MVVLDLAATAGSLSGRHVLLLNSALDPIVPEDHPARLAALLGSGGATVETVVHPEAGHGLAAEDLARANAFFANA
jgi:predicted esterase